MASDANRAFPTTAQLVEKVPLIKSPSFWVSKPVELPQDIHPLPENVEAYFVYPHTLETHALTHLPAALNALQTAHQSRLAKLQAYAEQKERARQEAMTKVAPGWSGGTLEAQSVLKPAGKVDSASPSAIASKSGAPPSARGESGQRDEMSDFLDGLWKLDSTLGGSSERDRA